MHAASRSREVTPALTTSTTPSTARPSTTASVTMIMGAVS